jgi:hypothetical protein
MLLTFNPHATDKPTPMLSNMLLIIALCASTETQS